MKKSTAAALSAVVLAGALAGCGGGSPANNGTGSYASSSVAAVASGTDMAANNGEAPLPGVSLPNAGLPEGHAQKLIWRVNMRLESTQFDRALQELTAGVVDAGGYIESSSVSGVSLRENGYGNERYASITARIPPDALDAFMNAVGTICNVAASERSSENITQEYADIEMRKKSLEIEEERLLALLEKADKLESIIELEERLSEVRYQIDSFTSSLHSYDSLVSYSTVTLDLREVARLTESGPVPVTLGEHISSGFSRSLRDIRQGAEALLVFALVNLPYLAIWAAVIAAALLIVRAAVRRAGKAAPGKNSGSAPASNYYRAPEQNERAETDEETKK